MEVPLPQHRTRASSILEAVEFNEADRHGESCWSLPPKLCLPIRVSCLGRNAIRTCARATAANLAQVFLQLQDAQASVLNEYSLDSFAERCVHFLVAIACMLRVSGGEWWLSVASSTAIARACICFISMYRICRRWKDILDSLRRGIPNAQFLDTSVDMIRFVGCMASTPSAAMAILLLLPNKSAIDAGGILLDGLFSAGALEFLTTFVLSAWTASCLGSAYSGSGPVPMSRAVALVFWRAILARCAAWHMAIAACLLHHGLLSNWTSAKEGRQWAIALRIWFILLPALLFIISGAAAIACIYRTIVLIRDKRIDAALLHIESGSIALLGSTAVVRPPRVRAQETTRLQAMSTSAWFLGTISTCTLFVASIWIAFLMQIEPLLRSFDRSPGLAAALHAFAIASQMRYTPSHPDYRVSVSQLILLYWLAVQIAGMMALLFVARALQSSWDAQDAADAARCVDAQAASAARADMITKSSSMYPLFATLERISDGVYRRTADDSRARALGVHIVDNPLHHVKNVVEALERRDLRSRAASAFVPCDIDLHHVVMGQIGHPADCADPIRDTKIGQPNYSPCDTDLKQGVTPSLVIRTVQLARPTVDSSFSNTVASLHLRLGREGAWAQQSRADSVLSCDEETEMKWCEERSPPSLTDAFAPPLDTTIACLPDYNLPTDLRAQTGPETGSQTAAHRNTMRVLSPLLPTRQRMAAPIALSISVHRPIFNNVTEHMAATLSPRGITPMSNPPRPPCFVCFDRPSDCILMECGHGGVCMTCAQAVAGSSGTCPVCRAPILQLVRVGPDTLTAGGQVVAMVLPWTYWAAADTS